MNMSPVVILTTVAAIASAAAAGMMYVFSTFVMRGLDRTGPVDAITAMRGINVEANNSAPFLLAYLGAAVLAIAVGVVAVVQFGKPGSGWLLAGAVVGVLGAVITIACNVPLNNHLDTVDPAAISPAKAAAEWQAYLTTWTAWNHVRTVTAAIAALLMLIGVRDR
ncbi:MAG TPA: anthrone oxygenase family protein [Mycobacterium sp.]|nr:anthrone oxygenase family protein [Mycobacterium sp.]